MSASNIRRSRSLGAESERTEEYRLWWRVCILQDFTGVPLLVTWPRCGRLSPGWQDPGVIEPLVRWTWSSIIRSRSFRRQRGRYHAT